MYLLSLTASNELGIPFHGYPEATVEHEEQLYPVYGGVDYASVIEIRGKVMDAKNRSKFALYWGYVTPQQSLVISGGIVGHYTQLQSENNVASLQNRFLKYQITGIEMNGKGEEFFSLMSRHPQVVMYPFWVTGRKPERLETQLAPWIELGKILINDADTPALNFLRKALAEFPHGNLDVLDSLYAIAQCIPHILQVPTTPKGAINAPNNFTKAIRTNPFGKIAGR